MRPDRKSPAPRRPLRALAGVAAAVALSVALPTTAAHADEATSGTRTVVGELVQAWPETALEGHAAHEHDDVAAAALTWVEDASGEAVRVPTEALAGIEVGATV